MAACKHPTCNGGPCRKVKPKKIPKPLKRTPIKVSNKQKSLKRTPIRKVSKKQHVILGEKKLQTAKDRAFFEEIWDEREHFCFESGEYLGMEPLTIYFHHLLPKALFPRFRYAKWNIVLLSWEQHSKAEVNLKFVPKVEALYKRLFKKYSSLKH